MRRPINDNTGDVFGHDPFGDTFEKWRIADAAKHIEADLEVFLQNGADHLGLTLKRSDAYQQGLTNGETILAVLTALSRVQVTFIGRLAALDFGPDDDEDAV